MCIAFSISKHLAHLRHAVNIPIVVETLEYRSDTEEVIVAFDCLVSNESAVPVDLWITHVDNVEGRLATEDWYSTADNNPDANAELIQDIHQGGWIFDCESGLLRYLDPSSATKFPEPIVAKALTFRPATESEGQVMQADRDSIDLAAPYTSHGRSGCSPVYRLLSFPECKEASTPNTELLPYTTFKVGPVPPNERGVLTLFRLTIVIAGDTYRRLVQPDDTGTFKVYSSDRVCNEISDFALHRFRDDSRCAEFRDFFASEITDTLVSPRKYQIVIRQPSPTEPQRKCIVVRPTSSRIGQRVICDDDIRRRALWFNTWSTDFSMVLAYSDRDACMEQGFRAKGDYADRSSSPSS